MSSEHSPTREPIELAPPAERGEPWWPVALAIIVAAGLHVALPSRYRVQPAWVVPAVLVGLLAVVSFSDWVELLFPVWILALSIDILVAGPKVSPDSNITP